MYCPSIVSPKGKWVKTSSGVTKMGSAVPGICKKSSSSVVRMNMPVIKPMPIAISHTASSGRNHAGLTNHVDWRTRSSAGLSPGKSLSAPNQKKIMPNPTRMKTRP